MIDEDRYEDSQGLISKSFDILYADPNSYNVTSCNFILWMIANMFRVELSGQWTVENYVYSYELTAQNESSLDMCKSMFRVIKTTLEGRLYDLHLQLEKNENVEEAARPGMLASFAAGVTQALLTRICLLSGETPEESIKVMNSYYKDFNNYLLTILSNSGTPMMVEEMVALGVKVGNDMDFESADFSKEEMSTRKFSVTYQHPAYYISHCANFVINILGQCTDSIITIRQVSEKEYEYGIAGRAAALKLLIPMIHTFIRDITDHVSVFVQSEEYSESTDIKNSLSSFVAGMTRGVVLRLTSSFANIGGREIEVDQNTINNYLEEIGLQRVGEKQEINLNTYVANLGVKAANEITLDIEDDSAVDSVNA